MEGLTLDDEKFKSIARLPARDVLNGQFAGVVASPLTGLVRGLGSMIQGLALQLGQIAEKGLVSGEAPADSPAGPVVEDDSSSSRDDAAGEEPSSTPPAGEAEEADAEEPKAEEAAEERDSEAEDDAGGGGFRGRARGGGQRMSSPRPTEADAAARTRTELTTRLQKLTTRARKRSRWQPKFQPTIGSRS